VQWNDGLLGWSIENHLRPGTVFVGQGSSKLPGSYKLLQNYPNPFNPTTSISYQLPANSFATIRVSDVLGREVAILVNGEEAPGSYSVQWDGSNSPSGVYFFRLEARRTDDGRDGVFVATKKMVLVK
jgi:hypothetical protein